MIRTFVAIQLSSGVAGALEALISRLLLLEKGGRRVKAGSMHLTLKFLGNVEEELLQGVVPVLRSIAGWTEPFKLVLSGVVSFPRQASTRVICLKVEKSPALEILQKAVEMGLYELGLPKDKRKYRPHITLIRFKVRRWIFHLPNFLEKEGKNNSRFFRVSHFNLYKSIVNLTGARYQILETFQLGNLRR